MSIESALKQWAASHAGQKKIAEAEQKAVKAGKKIGGSSGVQETYIDRCVRDLKRAVLNNLPASLVPSITMDSFLEPVITRKKDTTTIELYFDPVSVQRDSLVPARWDGVENIVVHLSNGWSARGAVYGDWHGQGTYSRADYPGDDFMRDAINEFNRSHREAKAELGSSYQKAP